MIVQSKRLMALLLAVGATAAIVALGGVALAAGASVTLEVKGQYARLHRTACHKTKSFRAFHRRSTIEARGFVTPHPALHFPVRLKLERCAGGHWRDVGDRSATGKKLTGKYKAFFSAGPLAPRSHRRGAIVYYSVRAFVAGGSSPKAYFAVTN